MIIISSIAHCIELLIVMHVNLIVLIVIHIICFILGLIRVLIHIFAIASYNHILSVEIVKCVLPILRLPIEDEILFIVAFR